MHLVHVVVWHGMTIVSRLPALQAVKADVSNKRAAAFIKRLLQVAMHTGANIAAGALLVASELLKAKPALWPMLTQGEDAAATDAAADAASSDHDTETDVNLDDSAADGGASAGRAPSAALASQPQQAWGGAQWPAEGGYDVQKRAPQHAHAERSSLWEVALLAQHAHPSAAVFAQTLLAGANVVYDGDPLKDLTLLAFLDKFVKRCGVWLLHLMFASWTHVVCEALHCSG